MLLSLQWFSICRDSAAFDCVMKSLIINWVWRIWVALSRSRHRCPPWHLSRIVGFSYGSFTYGHCLHWFQVALSIPSLNIRTLQCALPINIIWEWYAEVYQKMEELEHMAGIWRAHSLPCKNSKVTANVLRLAPWLHQFHPQLGTVSERW